MKINWIRCRSYDEARDFCRIIYLYEWNGGPFYWGKAENSFLGGHKRGRNGLRASGRYWLPTLDRGLPKARRRVVHRATP
jgi:hypothetical protein